MASIEQLSNRLRSEIGDIARTFNDTFVGDGVTQRFQLSQAPVQGYSLQVTVGGTDVSSSVVIEEAVGLMYLPNAPADLAGVVVVGQSYKYFTDSEIQYYINNAFLEHSRNSTDVNGSRVNQIALLPPIEEYPLVLLASTMALYTLATDAAFDINISSPDGVTIPRAQRFNQLMQIVQERKNQYKELCALLNIGLHRIEVQTLRRISRGTNRYVPIYRPMEIDDASLPQRVRLNMPNYGDITPPSPVLSYDLSAYSGDDFSIEYQCGFDLDEYTPKGQIRLFGNQSYAQVGPQLLGEFTITKFAYDSNGQVDSLRISLPATVTSKLPRTAYYDVQMTGPTGEVKTYLTGKIFTETQVTT
jgi:hypothetical protein